MVVMVAGVEMVDQVRACAPLETVVVVEMVEMVEMAEMVAH